MWPHSPPAHSRPDFELGRGRQVMGGVRCGLRIGLPTSTRGNHTARDRGLIVLTTAALVAHARAGTTAHAAPKDAMQITTPTPAWLQNAPDGRNGIPIEVSDTKGAVYA